MKSVRLSPTQHQRLAAAAARKGVTESELIRYAVDRACAETLDGQESLFERLADLLGAGHGGGGRAERSSEAFAELLAEDEARDPR